jgi:hypothetical protein
MFRFIDSPDDTIALTIEHKVTGADLDAIMDWLDAAFAAHEKVNVFVETRGIDGIELSGLGRYTARALPLFGKLTRFGRVAVVADQAWIRAATRVESALLPFIGYRVFTPDERDQALAWVGIAPETGGTA